MKMCLNQNTNSLWCKKEDCPGSLIVDDGAADKRMHSLSTDITSSLWMLFDLCTAHKNNYWRRRKQIVLQQPSDTRQSSVWFMHVRWKTVPQSRTRDKCRCLSTEDKVRGSQHWCQAGSLSERYDGARPWTDLYTSIARVVTATPSWTLSERCRTVMPGCPSCTESSSSWHWWCSQSTHAAAQTLGNSVQACDSDPAQTRLR